MERHNPISGEIYRHFKNKLYQIVAIAKHSETKEELVIYQALYDDFEYYARPLTMFMSEVDHNKYPDVEAKYRFTKLDKSSLKKDSATLKSDSYSTKNDNDETLLMEATKEKTSDEGQINPDLLAFLEANTYEDKKKELIFMKPRLTDEIINSMAASLDLSVDDGDIEDRFSSLLNCLSTMQKYEITNRLR